MWDFSKGHPCKILDFGLPEMNGCSTAGQCFNPAFVHALAVPDVDMSDKLGRICVVARGDGVVDVINIESELTDVKSKSSIKSRKGTQSVSKHRIPGDLGTSHQNGRKRLQLDYSFGGHTGAVSCVQFSMFGERGKFIISGGNDKFVKVWDCFGCLDAGQTSSTTNPLHLNISLNKKVNWLCTTPSESENLIVCDTTKVVKVFSVS